MSQRAAWIGLGVMGYPMAGHLKSKGGLPVTVYNRTAEKAAKWAGQFNDKTAPTPAASRLARQADQRRAPPSTSAESTLASRTANSSTTRGRGRAGLSGGCSVTAPILPTQAAPRHAPVPV